MLVAGVVEPEVALPAAYGAVPNTLTLDGGRLPCWLLGQLAPMPGAFVTARLVGLLDTADVPVLLAALPGDSTYGECVSADELTVQGVRALSGASSGTRVRGAEEAVELLQTCRERAASAYSAAHIGGRISKAWQAAHVRAERHGEGEPHTAAERDVLLLPSRFQRYVAECLRPEERILFFLTRPPGHAPAARLRFLGRKRLHDAVLVITDQQVLLVEDAIPPDSTMVHWGYVASTVPPERLVGCEVVETGGEVVLVLHIGCGSAGSKWSIPFQGDRLSLLREAQEVLTRFMAAPDSRALQRQYDVSDRQAQHEELGDVEREWLQKLTADLDAQLPRGEAVLARAFSPGAPDGTLPGTLVAASRQRVLLIQPGQTTALHLTSVARLELRHSLLSSGLGISAVVDGREWMYQVPFGGLMVPSFVQLFVVLRQLAASPRPAAGSGGTAQAAADENRRYG